MSKHSPSVIFAILIALTQHKRSMDLDRFLWKIKYTLPVRLIRMPLNHARRLWRRLVAFGYQHFGFPKPRTFTEKLEWIKRYERDPRMVVMADKAEVRGFVKERIGGQYLIPCLGVYRRVEEIPFDTLPDQFVLKVNNASGANIICTDKTKLDINRARRQLQAWLNRRNFSSVEHEWHYARIEPAVVCESFVQDSKGELNDYKFFCFHGEPKYVWVDIARHDAEKRSRNVFDERWNPLPLQLHVPRFLGNIPPPAHFDKMLELARKLSRGFKSVRVDLYNVDGKIYFGEMTFFSGDLFFCPRKYDRIWGDQLDLDCR